MIEQIQFIQITQPELKGLIKACLTEVLAEQNLEHSSKDKEPELLNFKQLMRLLDLSAPTIHKMKKQGKIPYQRVGGRKLMFDKQKVLVALKNNQN